jgi:hypothetical protein
MVLDRLDDPDEVTMVGQIGGDGAINDLVEILMDPSTPDHIARAPIWTPGGGNAINLFRSVTGKEYQDHPEKALSEGFIDSFTPLFCEVVMPDGTVKQMHSATVLGFGGTAMMVLELEKPSHRNRPIREREWGRNLVDPIAVMKGVAKSRRIEFIDEEGESQRLFERLYLNVPRAAKVIVAPGVHVTGPAHKVEIKRRNPFEVALSLTRLALDKSKGEDLEGTDSFIVGERRPMYCQNDGDDAFLEDGENHPIPPGSKVSVGYAEKDVRFVTTIAKP